LNQKIQKTKFFKIKDLASLGFSRTESYKIMKVMKTDFVNSGFILTNNKNSIPLSYASKWIEEKLSIIIEIN
jgi:hypothetical protein